MKVPMKNLKQSKGTSAEIHKAQVNKIGMRKGMHISLLAGHKGTKPSHLSRKSSGGSNPKFVNIKSGVSK